MGDPSDERDDHERGPPAAAALASASGPRRRRRWPWWVLCLLVRRRAGSTLVPFTALCRAARSPSGPRHARWGAAVTVERVEVAWSRLAIDAYGVRFDDGVRLEVDIARLEIDLAWEDLLAGSRRPTIVVHQPFITLEARSAPPREDQPPPEDMSAFEALEIVDGTLELVLPTEREPAFVDLTEISARIDNRRELAASATMDLGIHATARVGESGTLQVDGRASSRAPAQAWSVRFELERFELPILNQLWLSIVEMDVDRGFLSLEGELTRGPTRLRGRVRPRFEEVVLLGADEDALHPMAEALFGPMLMGSANTIAIDRPMTEAGSSLPELLQEDWRTLLQHAIRQGYARRLSTLRGFSATIGDVQVDFSQGLMQLYDVEIDTQAPVLKTPLVTIGQVDVVFDAAVAHAGVPAYKHVTLWRPTLSFATGVEGADNRLQFDEAWLDKISAVPFPTRDLVVHQGRLDVYDLRDDEDEPVHVFVGDIELRGAQMARELHPAGVRGAELSGTATVLGEAPASIRVVYEPRAPVPNLDMDLRLEPVALTTLAPALQVYAGVDAVEGRVGFSAHLAARDHRIEASVVPEVHRPKLQAMGGLMLRKLLVGRALRRLQSRVIELRYTMEPDEGLLHEFFPQLIQAVFLGR
ncbi:MAG: DUF748 domain-containing protein [Myxococcales bacterium]|nr:DUF748 domain-containing protein [Myxococcales bacterium]